MKEVRTDSSVCLFFCLPEKRWITRKDLRVQLGEAFNRAPHKDDGSIDTIWSSRCAQNPSLYNGSKFRFHGIERRQTGDSVTVRLELGSTSYKEFLGTNCSPTADQLFREGQVVHKNGHCHMSDALGVGALLVTKDEEVVLMRRSAHCGEDQGKWDTPGGHPEPSKLPHTEDSRLLERCAGDEVFDSIVAEIVDEVGLSRADLTPPLLMGVDRNRLTWGRPTAQFFVRTGLSSAEVATLYNKGEHAEAEESTALKTVPVSSLTDVPESPLWSVLAPSAKGCLLCYLNRMTDACPSGKLEPF